MPEDDDALRNKRAEVWESIGQYFCEGLTISPKMVPPHSRIRSRVLNSRFPVMTSQRDLVQETPQDPIRFFIDEAAEINLEFLRSHNINPPIIPIHQGRTVQDIDNWMTMWRNRAGDIMGVDRAANPTEDRMEKPEVDEKFEAMDKYPVLVKEGIFKAHLINSTMRAWQESEDMGNCLYKSYTRQISAGLYVAYHIEAPRPYNRSGYTIGFEKEKEFWWEFDQMEAKGGQSANDYDADMRFFIAYLLFNIRKAEDGK